MIIKRILLALSTLLLVFFLIQLVPVSFLGGMLYPAYSADAMNASRSRATMAMHSFLGVKMHADESYAWVYLRDLKKSTGLEARIFNRQGDEVKAPGYVVSRSNRLVLETIHDRSGKPGEKISWRHHTMAIPMVADKRCAFCHTAEPGDVVGVMLVDQKIADGLWYSPERIVLFAALSLCSCVFMLILLKWDPARSIDNLFDKS